MTAMVEVTQEDANNYCSVLKALGMEEEGNPVAAIEMLREAEKTVMRMSEALQTIAAMQDQTYYKVNPKETAKDAHLIAVGALANDAGEMREAKGVTK